MNKRISILVIISLLFTNSFFSQKTSRISRHLQKYIEVKQQDNYSIYIYFKDKGDDISVKLKNAEGKLPANSIKRRQKIMTNKSSLATFYDIPVNENYYNETSKYISKLRHKLKWLNAISAEVTKENIEIISKLPFVTKIDIVRKGKVTRSNNFVDFQKRIQNNPFQKNITNSKYNLDYGSSLTQVEQINVPAVHDMGYHGENVIICVMDAGFNNLEHPVFANMQSEGRLLGTWDFVNDDENVDDQDEDLGSGSHGTNTLSTIGGFFEGELIGPAYKAKFVLAKTENTESETTLEEDNWVAAVQWAEDNYGPDVTSTSLGYISFDDGTGYDATELDGNTATITIGADIAAELGILVVNSAGNEGSGTTTIGAPADGDSVLAVGAVEASGTRSYFSSVGPTSDGRIKPDVMAMGSSVVVAESVSGSGYTTSSGTSFSCPLTGGAAALLVQMLPTVNNMDIIDAMRMTANNSASPNNEYGWGILDTKAAYEYFVPQIIHTPLSDTEDFNGPYVITAQINSRTDLISGEQKVYWRRDGGTWQTAVMSLNADTYGVEIIGNGTEATYDYYFEATNTITSRKLPENAPSTFFTFSTIVDNTSPEINHTAIKEYYKNLFNNAVINSEMTDNTGINLANTYVEWFVNDVAKDNFFFTELENNNYSAKFPAYNPNINDIIKYRIVAHDNASSPHITYYPASGYEEFEITDKISFEQNQFSHNWDFYGSANWFVTNTEHQDGNHCMKSGDINDLANTSIAISFTSSNAGQVSFYKKVSCEEDTYSHDYDYLVFLIDDIEKDRWDGEIAWSQENYNINAGEHTINFTYHKDFSVSEGSDCAWVDNITLPEGVTDVKMITKNNISVFPNPASSFISFSGIDNNSKIVIFDTTGKRIKTINSYNNNNINISDLNNGLYLCKIVSGNSVSFSKFIIKK